MASGQGFLASAHDQRIPNAHFVLSVQHAVNPTCEGRTALVLSYLDATANVLGRDRFDKQEADKQQDCRRFWLEDPLLPRKSSDQQWWTLPEIVERLRSSYCGTLAVELDHVFKRCIACQIANLPPGGPQRCANLSGQIQARNLYLPQPTACCCLDATCAQMVPLCSSFGRLCLMCMQLSVIHTLSDRTRADPTRGV